MEAGGRGGVFSLATLSSRDFSKSGQALNDSSLLTMYAYTSVFLALTHSLVRLLDQLVLGVDQTLSRARSLASSLESRTNDGRPNRSEAGERTTTTTTTSTTRRRRPTAGQKRGEKREEKEERREREGEPEKQAKAMHQPDTQTQIDGQAGSPTRKPAGKERNVEGKREREGGRNDGGSRRTTTRNESNGRERPRPAVTRSVGRSKGPGKSALPVYRTGERRAMSRYREVRF